MSQQTQSGTGALEHSRRAVGLYWILKKLDLIPATATGQINLPMRVRASKQKEVSFFLVLLCELPPQDVAQI